VLACRERYRLVGPDPCLVTTTVLRCPLKVSFARRFLTSLSALRWVANKPKPSSPMRTDQPSLVGSTRKTVVIACLVTNELSTNRRSSASCGLGTRIVDCAVRPRQEPQTARILVLLQYASGFALVAIILPDAWNVGFPGWDFVVMVGVWAMLYPLGQAALWWRLSRRNKLGPTV
jgi:hypothetical protein